MKQLIFLLFVLGACVIVQAQPDTLLMGLANGGGANGEGTIYLFNPATNDLQKLHDFDEPDGRYPWNTVIQMADGMIYGLTNSGGSGDDGVIFSYEPGTGQYQKVKELDPTTGTVPLNGFVEYNGKLYTSTNGGGQFGYGTILEFDPATSNTTVLVDFDSATTGGYPWGGMVVSGNSLFGTANVGLDVGNGVLFEYDLANDTFKVRAEFKNISAYGPTAKLYLASNGAIYGTTTLGGGLQRGVLFRFYPPTGTFVADAEMNDIVGRFPFSGVMEGDSGVLYGVTELGGLNNAGIVYKYVLSSATLTKIFDFGGAGDGEYPTSQLVKHPNGLLYGVTREGGTHNLGTIFSVNPANDLVSTLANLEASSTGGYLIRGLTVVTGNFAITGDNHVEVESIQAHPNPARETILLSGLAGYPQATLTITNTLGQVVHQETLMGNPVRVSVADWAGGMYLVTVDQDGMPVATGKFVVEGP